MMGRCFAVACATIAACAAPHEASAADLPSRTIAPVLEPLPVFSWTGAYLGAFLGGGAGDATFADPRGTSLYGGAIHPSIVEGGGTVGYNVAVPRSRFVAGIEADGGAVASNGTNTCIAFSGNVVPANCRVDGRAMATGTARIGYAFGAAGQTLAYVKGGVAALFEERDVSSNNSGFAARIGFPNQPSAIFTDRPQVGFTVGAGIEQALSNAWSLKVEYDYADFGASRMATPGTLSHLPVPGAGYFAVSTPATRLEQSVQMLKVGLDYHIGAAPGAMPGDLLAAPRAAPFAGLPSHATAPNYAVEVGGRYWYSFGRFQRDLGGQGQPNNSLISRLTYQSRSSSGEVFGRIDMPSRLFVKGVVGAGGTDAGHGNDEDFDFSHGSYSVAYQNAQGPLRGDLDYATVDLGYSVLETRQARVGGFVGYNHYRDDDDRFGCTQIANPAGGCEPSQPPTNSPRLVQNETFDSLRVGVSGDMWFERLRLQSDVAYLPFVGFNGTDIHPLRTDVPSMVSREFGRGQGVQLELIASYYLTRDLSIGVGGRYWGFLVPNATTNDFDLGIFPDAVHAERYGVTAQLGYRFSSFSPPAAADR